jgi:hypothetical protein
LVGANLLGDNAERTPSPFNGEGKMTRKFFAALVAAALVAACADSLPTEPRDTTSSVQPRFEDTTQPPDTVCRNGMLGSGTRC